MIKRWLYKEKPSQEEIQRLGQELNVNPYLTSVLLQRGIQDFESARKFFRPSVDQLHDPFLMKDMEAAVERIKTAVDQKEKILVYGDYDVDGTTAVSLVYTYLKSFYADCDFYIPDRHAEGYGVSEEGIHYADQNNFSLIIALDLGIKASDMVTLANRKGIDFIICDHHLPGSSIPNAVAVLDPKRADCPYPFKELSGCGLGFKLVQAYARRYGREDQIYRYIDLVAVSIASDIVPINDENRVLAFFGLKKLNEDPMPGLKALKDIAGIKNELDIAGVVFTLGRGTPDRYDRRGSKRISCQSQFEKRPSARIRPQHYGRSDCYDRRRRVLQDSKIHRVVQGHLAQGGDWHSRSPVCRKILPAYDHHDRVE
jgi:single-stranded-DNA-specific exonuclease